MIEIISGLILLILLINLNAVGYFILNLKENSDKSISVNLLFGFSTLILFSHFFAAGLNSLQIISIFLSISFVISFLSFKTRRGFLDNTKEILLISLPIIIFFIFLAIIYGEQFYVFRGNK